MRVLVSADDQMFTVISSLQKRFPESVPPSLVSHENPWIGSLERASSVAWRKFAWRFFVGNGIGNRGW